MEQLNQFLQELVSTSSYELRLEPNKNPYIVNADGNSEVSAVPLQGTQISMLVFPLIPAEVKSDLPNQPEINFTHPHRLGKFSFNVKKSPAGFNVTVRPVTGDDGAQASIPDSEPAAEPGAPPMTAPETSQFVSEPAQSYVPEPVSQYVSEPAQQYIPEPAIQAAPEYVQPSPEMPFEFESSSLASQAAPVYSPGDSQLPMIEVEAAHVVETFASDTQIPDVVSAFDPQFQTVFSDTSNYEPPGRRDDFGFDPSSFASPEIPSAPQTRPAVELPVEDRRTTDRRQKNLMAAARMDALFKLMADFGASDLHLSVSMPPMVRKDGKMQRLECSESELNDLVMRELLVSIMPDKNLDEFDRRHDTDFAYEIEGLARFRCNVFMDRKGMGGVFRIIPSEILTAEKLGLSKAIMDLCALSKGLVVVTGPTGSGKSTTLCAMVDSINKSREDHIITIEDPIEFVHENQKCLVNQREVHNHTDSFKDALRAALRGDPDILLVGEMRDLETISIAIETAETGHLVFGTLHTTTAPSTVDRIIDQFPADRQQQIRVMLSESLKGVIAQTLLPKIGGGRVAALEVLIITPAISNLIREGKTFQIQSAMQTGKNHGMQMLNDSLFDLVQKKLVEPRDAYIKAVDKANFETMLTRGGFKI